MQNTLKCPIYSLKLPLQAYEQAHLQVVVFFLASILRCTISQVNMSCEHFGGVAISCTVSELNWAHNPCLQEMLAKFYSPNIFKKNEPKVDASEFTSYRKLMFHFFPVIGKLQAKRVKLCPVWTSTTKTQLGGEREATKTQQKPQELAYFERQWGRLHLSIC